MELKYFQDNEWIERAREREEAEENGMTNTVMYQYEWQRYPGFSLEGWPEKEILTPENVKEICEQEAIVMKNAKWKKHFCYKGQRSQ